MKVAKNIYNMRIKFVRGIVKNKMGVPIKSIRSLATGLEESKISSAKPWSEVPQPWGIPFFGSLQFMTNDALEGMHKVHSDLKGKYGDIYKITLFGDTLLHIHDPRDAETVLRNDGPMPVLPSFDPLATVRKTDMKKYYPETIGLFSQNEDWLEFRQAVQQDMMRPKNALYYIKDIEKIAGEFNDVLASNKDTQGRTSIGNLTQQFALESICCIFVGKSLRVLRGSEEGEFLINRANILQKNMLPLIFVPTPLAKRMKFFKDFTTAFREMFEMLSPIIQEAIHNIDIEDESDGSVLAKLVRKHGKDSQIPLVMAVDALTAGIDTTGHTASLLLYHLARNPKKQELLYKEIVSCMGVEGEMSEQSFSKMKFLKACLIESQRMLPVILGTERQTKVDLVLSCYQIPAGTKILRHGQLMQNSEKHFTSPEKFLPERWIRGHLANNSAHPYANIPFGHGPRACVGQRFAKLELLVLLAKVVQRYKMEYTGEEVDVRTGFVSAPDKDIIITFKER